MESPEKINRPTRPNQTARQTRTTEAPQLEWNRKDTFSPVLGSVARAAWEESSWFDLPPASLMEFAHWLGNSGMCDLLESRTPQPRLCPDGPRLSEQNGPVFLEPIPVPKEPPALVHPEPLLWAETDVSPFDPAGFVPDTDIPL